MHHNRQVLTLIVVPAMLTVLAPKTSAQTCVQTTNTPAGLIFSAEVDGLGVQAMNIDGSNQQVIFNGSPTGHLDVAVDSVAKKLYVTSDNSLTGGIYRMDFDGSNVEHLISSDQTGSIVQLGGIALDVEANRMWWIDYDAPRLVTSDLDGQGVSTLLGLSGDPAFLELDRDAGQLYWTNLTDGTIRRVNTDGTGETVVFASSGLPIGLAIDEGEDHLYYTVFDTVLQKGEVRRVGLDGTGDVLITNSVTLPIGLEVVPELDLLAVSEEGPTLTTGTMWTGDLDGGDFAPVATGLAGVGGVAVFAEAAPSLYHDVDNVCLVGGGSQDLVLNAGTANAGNLYLIAGSSTGTAGLPANGVILPLTFDAYTSFTLTAEPSVFQDFVGFIGSDGLAKATITLPGTLSPALAGTTLYHAGIVVTLPDLAGTLATNAAPLQLTL